MKLYIITSILNIDNVLSSESISPASFYKNRTFGYRHFELIPNFKIPLGKIPLFDYLPYVEIIDENQVDYPFVIEIYDSNQLSDTKIEKWQDGIFFSNRTLYINPFNCRLLFFSPEAYNEAELRCSDSKTNKLYKYFQKSIVYKEKAKDISTINLPTSEDDNKIDEYIKTDEKINSTKGFLLGWYLGSGKNIDPIFAKLKSIEKRTYDYVSAIKNNNGVVTPAYREALNELDKQYKCYDPNIRKAQDLWNEEINSFCSNKDAFSLFLKKYGVESEVKNAFSQILNIPHRKNFPVENYESFMNEMTNYTYLLQQNSQPSYSFYKGTDSDDSKLYSILISSLFFSNRFLLEDLRVNRSVAAKNFITVIKQFIVDNGQKWENGGEYEYLQSLMLNIVNSDFFDFQSTQNDLLKSVAAFLLKGDDYDDMMSYLQNNAMSSYCYVLGLWGAACGYVDMPRSITNVLFDSSDFKWDQVYKQIHKEVFGYDLLGTIDIEPKAEGKSNVLCQGMKKIGRKAVESLTGKTEGQTQEEDSSILQRQFDIPEELKLLFETVAFKELPLSAQQYYKKESLALYQGRVDKPYIEAVKKIEYPKTKGKWQNVVKLLSQKQKKEKQSIDTLTLFAQPSNQLFYLDKKAFDCLLPVLPNDKKILKQFQIDLKWFQDNYQNSYYDDKKGEIEGMYFKNPKDNISVIANFERVLNGKLNNHKAPWLKDIYGKIDIIVVINKLRELYQ